MQALACDSTAPRSLSCRKENGAERKGKNKMSYLIVSWNSSGSGFTRQAFPPLKHVRFLLATPGTEACDAMGGAFRPQRRELPAIVLRLSLPCRPKRSRIDAKHGDHFLQVLGLHRKRDGAKRLHEHGVLARFRYNGLKEAARAADAGPMQIQ
jgi:hypothetical protein